MRADAQNITVSTPLDTVLPTFRKHIHRQLDRMYYDSENGDWNVGFFIYDITLDDEGMIADIGIMQMDSSINDKWPRKLIPDIIAKWKPAKGFIRKIWQPVLLVNNGVSHSRPERIEKPGDAGIYRMASLFAVIRRGETDPPVYISPTIEVYFP